MPIRIDHTFLRAPHPLVTSASFVLFERPRPVLDFIPLTMCCYALLEPASTLQAVIADINDETVVIIAHCSATGRTSVSHAIAKDTDWSLYAQQLAWLTKESKKEVNIVVAALPMERRKLVDPHLETTLRSVAAKVNIPVTLTSTALSPLSMAVQLAVTDAGKVSRPAALDDDAVQLHGLRMMGKTQTSMQKLGHIVDSFAAQGSWCAYCGKSEGLRRCSGCAWETYCSVEHQKLDYADHRSWCMKNRKSTSS
ncbi:hypothetical protein BCR35DRAFT_313278 [Leucosporidium creatinivorum]|uniref:MYND-type domain-containing protein n=1 Tax=Leucosporidium creatinivorum TaxID=106004 RepID=A0A1Y2FRV7_9BASI|nr:hypothetical protein BCR35DRAFT_313278 [Leucosporidium creatinivorum]